MRGSRGACAVSPRGDFVTRTKRSGRSFTFAAGIGIVLVYFVAARMAMPTKLLPLGEFILRAHAPNLLLIAAGRLDLDCRIDRIAVQACTSLLLVEANACADLIKTPGGMEQRFRSIYLTLSPELLAAFRRGRALESETLPASASFRKIPLDADLGSSLQHVLAGAGARPVSDERLRYRALDFLAALAERGFAFRPPVAPGMSGRLRALIGEAPGQHWTAQTAGKALAVSEATLRRRLAAMLYEGLLLFGVMFGATAIFLLLRAIIPPLARTGDIGLQVWGFLALGLYFVVAQETFAWGSLRVLGKAGADISVIDEKKRTPLTIAVELNYAQTVKTLLELGADVDRDLFLDPEIAAQV